jgi:glycerol-3-phosphate dehydrogenase (NAD(P)+)
MLLRKKIVVLGSGGWGTSLALLLNDNGHDVKIWCYEPEVAEEINSKHTNSNYLNDVILPESLIAITESKEVDKADIIVNTIPTQFIRHNISEFKVNFKNQLIINGSKGIENNSLMRISELFFNCADIPKDNFAVLTGPSHAEEVSRKMPTTVVAASYRKRNSKLIQKLFSNNYFRVYRSKDVIGCELGGSLKNVIAIAAGVIDGLGFGDNTKAALITRGLAEMSRLGTELGASPLTFSGLSGLGDLIVTCDSKHSRNRLVGEKIGKGMTLDEVLKSMKMVAEGVNTTESVVQLGKKLNIEMPIAEKMYEILFHNTSPLEAINDLMNRDFKKEWW